MDSAGNRTLVAKEKQEETLVLDDTSLENFPVVLKTLVTSYLAEDETAKILTAFDRTPSIAKFFSNPAVYWAIKVREAISNFAERKYVNETLADIRNNPQMLQTFAFHIDSVDRYRQRFSRPSLIEALVALDEVDVIAPEAKVEPYGLISTIFSYFNGDDAKSLNIKKQLQQQLIAASGDDHKEETKKRNACYLNKIEIFINAVISSNDISNDSDGVPFENLFDLPFVQDFMENIFKLEPDDAGKLGIMFDCWQLNLDYIDLLKKYINGEGIKENSRPNLGDWWSRKTDLVDIAVYMAILRRSQFCHLEVFAKGIGRVSNGIAPILFDCSAGRPEILDGIGFTDGFGFSGNKLPRGGLRRVLRYGAGPRLRKFYQTKTSALHSLCGQNHIQRRRAAV